MTETPSTRPREIEALIPHRWPFLLVDRIVEYDPEAKRIVGIKGVTATEWFFQGHFPGLPVMPGVLQVEALAQTMAVYVAKQPGFGDRIGLFAGIDDVPLQADRQPGDTLRLEVTMEKLGGALRPRPRRRQRRWRGRLRGDRSASSSRPKGCCDDPASPSCPTSTATPSRSRPCWQGDRAARSRTSSLVAGDLVLNGPDPAGAVDVLRELEADGAAIVSGNTDIAVADFDYAAAFPWMTDGVPDAIVGRRRVGARRARRRAARLAAPAAGRAPPAGRRRHAGPGLPRLAGLADRGLRPGPRPDRRHRARRRGPTPGSSPAATPTCPRSATSAGSSSSTTARRATCSTATRPPRGRSSTSTTTRSRPRSGGPSSTPSRSPTRSRPAACRATSTAPPRSAPGSWSDDASRRRVVVTGMGMVTAARQRRRRRTWAGLVAGRSGVRTIEAFDPSRLTVADRRRGARLRRRAASSTARSMRRTDRYIQFGARRRARGAGPGRPAGAPRGRARRADRASILGTGLGGVGTLVDGFTINALRGPDRISPFLIPMGIPNVGAGQIAINFGMTGPELRDGVGLRHRRPRHRRGVRDRSAAATPTS